MTKAEVNKLDDFLTKNLHFKINEEYICELNLQLRFKFNNYLLLVFYCCIFYYNFS